MMNEREQAIVSTIEEIPALYGKLDRQEEAVKSVRKLFADQVNNIFFVEFSADRATRVTKLENIAEKAGPLLCTRPHKMKWLRIKTGKGKTEKSRKCTIEVFKGEFHPDYEPPETGMVTFYAPASMIYEDAGGDAWLPEFFVIKKLAETKERSRYRFQQYDRIVNQDAFWPGKEEYLTALIALLPSQEEIDKTQEELSVRAAHQRKENEARFAAQRTEQEERKRVEEAKAAAAKKKKDTRRAKMEQVLDLRLA